jgi:hypothetical protein
MFCGMNVDIGPAALPLWPSLSDGTLLMNSLLFAAQCSSGLQQKVARKNGTWRLPVKR